MMLCDFIQNLEPLEEGAATYVDAILEELVASGLAKTPEGVAIWLAVRSKDLKVSFPAYIWHKNDPLCRKERQALAAALKEKSQGFDSDANPTHFVKSGSWRAYVNFAWFKVLEELLLRCRGADDVPGSADVDYFAKSWIEIIDNTLFSQASSSERKFWGFQIFSKMLVTSPEWALSAMFSPNLMRCLINQRMDSQRALYDAAAEPLRKIQARAKHNPHLAPLFVIGLTTGNGTLFFDRATKTKTVEEQLMVAESSGMLAIVRHFEKLLSRPEADEEHSADTIRQNLADFLLNSARNRTKRDVEAVTATSTEEWLLSLVRLFSRFAYCVPRPNTKSETWPVPMIPSSSRTMFQSRISSLLAHLLSSRSQARSFLPEFVVDNVRDFTKSSSSWELALKADNKVLQILKKAYRNIDELKSTQSTGPVHDAFRLLFSLTTLQVFAGDADAVTILDELDTCHASIIRDSSTNDSAFEVIIEVLLSFISRPMALYRKIVEQVFSAITPHITEPCLHSLIEVLQKSENATGQEQLFDQQEDGGDSENESGTSSDVNDSSDVEVLATRMAKANSPGVESSSVHDSDAESSEGTENEDDSELLAFENKVADALQTSRAEDDAGSSSEESDMDDEQMMAIEDLLTTIFRERKAASSASKKKKAQHKAKVNMINLKNRILDLFSIYVKQQYNDCLVLKLILPILQLMRKTSSQQLATKASDLLKSLLATCSKHKAYPTVKDVEETFQLLESVHDEAKQDSSKQHLGACSRASLLIVRVLVNVDRANYFRVANIYAQTQNDWFTDVKVRIQPTFFTEWVSWTAEMRKAK
jgi:hypothetical protein